MMKRILVPTDFSQCASNASDAAIRLAKASGATLYFLHLTVEPNSPSHVPGKPAVQVETEIGQARYWLDQLVGKAESAGVVAKGELVIGNGQERIEDYVEPFGIDFLVMGSHGATGIRETVIGSKTQHVIRNIRVPSLVIKRPIERANFSNLLFASTFKSDVGEALAVTANFAKLWQSTIHLLFINLIEHLIDEDVAHMMMIKQTERFKDVRFTYNTTDTNDKEFGITEFASKVDADLIAVALENKSVLKRIFSPSLTEQLINHSERPVLVANSE